MNPIGISGTFGLQAEEDVRSIIERLPAESVAQLIRNFAANRMAGSLNRAETDFAPVVKLFVPGSRAVWLLSEYNPDELTAFGLCDLGMGFPEMGYVAVDELDDAHDAFGIVVAHDRSFTADKPLSAYAAEAHRTGHIVT